MNAGELSNPDIAWPTVILFLVASSLFLLFAWLGVSKSAPLYVTLPIQTILAFALFTPTHDATHSAVGKGKFKWINYLVGRCYGFLVLAPFPAFRWIHLSHHKHTNTHHDPDNWSKGIVIEIYSSTQSLGGSSSLFLPLFWATQDFHYYTHYIPEALYHQRRPFWEVVESLATLIALYTIPYQLCVKGYAYETFMFWILPTRLSTTLLAWLFDYVPHRPHKVSSFIYFSLTLCI